MSGVSSGMVLTYASTPQDDSRAWTVVSTRLSESSTIGAIGAVGWNIKFDTPTPTTTHTFTSTPTSSTNNSASFDVTTNPPSAASSGGLTAGAKVGIGVGVSVGALGIVALGVPLYFYRKRNPRTPADPTVSYPYQYQPAMAQPEGQPQQREQFAELDAAKHNPVAAANVQPVELQ